MRHSESASCSSELSSRLSSSGDMWSWETHPLSWLPGQLRARQAFQESHVQESIKKKHGITYV